MKIYLMLLFAFYFGSASVAFGAFDEDSYLFEALEFETQGKFNKARDAYLVLYEETKKLEYFKEAILSSSMEGNPSATLDFTFEYLNKGGQKDIVIHKILLDCYLKLGLAEKAFEEAKYILSIEDTAVIHDIIGSLYAQQNKLDLAEKSLNIAYQRTHSQDVLRKIVSIYMLQGNHTGALSKLNKHIEEYGCVGNFCDFSIELYAQTGQKDRIEQIFKAKFDADPTIQNAQNLINIYAHNGKFKEASEIAARYPLNPQILLQLYIAQKDYKNASIQAQYLYEENKNPYYLALSQVYAFEILSNKQDKKKVKNIIKELKEALKQMQVPSSDVPKGERIDNSLQNYQSEDIAFFFNFLGYLMIDYDVDVKDGLGYVKKALEISPQNVSYLDSLAWGYYKLKDCKQAKDIFAKIPQSEIDKESELKSHKADIEKCKI